MTNGKFFLRKNLVALLAILLSTGAYAERPQTPPPKGVGMLVGGIVATSVGVGLGGIVFIFAGPSSTHGNAEGGYAALGIAALGAGIGIPLIIGGASRLRAYKQWRRDQQEEVDVGQTGQRQWDLSLRMIERKPAASLTYAF